MVDLKEKSGFVPREGVEGGDVESNEVEDESTSAPRVGEVQDKTRRDKPRRDWLCNMARKRGSAVRAWA